MKKIITVSAITFGVLMLIQGVFANPIAVPDSRLPEIIPEAPRTPDMGMVSVIGVVIVVVAIVAIVALIKISGKKK